jgi:putative heme iron utilization protein
LAAKRLLREARIGALASLTPDGGPYASLVTVATLADNSPVLLLSALARHSENIRRDARVSLLVKERASGDPLQGARLSIVGRIGQTEDRAARRRFLARHPAAEFYADFKDFGFWRIEIEGGHLVAGFGRIVDLTREQLLTSLTDADGLLEAEAGAIAHMNEDHLDAIGLYATRLLGAEAGDWRVISIDPDGCDLLCAERVRRLDFPVRVRTAAELRKALGELAQRARAV